MNALAQSIENAMCVYSLLYCLGNQYIIVFTQSQSTILDYSMTDSPLQDCFSGSLC